MAKVVYRDIKGSGKRKINIECRLSPKFIQNVKTVSAFFIFYQPFSNIHQARHLLVGYSQDILWAQPYRIRMFPQFKTMLRDKSATCTADKGNGVPVFDTFLSYFFQLISVLLPIITVE